MVNWKSAWFFCLPIKPALKSVVIHYNSQRSFLQRNLSLSRKNDLIRSRTEHSSCVAGRRYIACTSGEFSPSITIHYILIQSLHKTPFSYSTLSFSLLSHSGLEKKNVVDGMLTAFQIFHAKMPFTPTVTASFSFSLILHQNKVGGEGKRGKENKLKVFSIYLN